MTARMSYETCCVDSDGPSIIAMMNRAREITCSTWKRCCEWQDIAQSMGYAIGPQARQNKHYLRIDQDYHVRFYRSVFKSRPCYVLVHSAIEYIFTVLDDRK